MKQILLGNTGISVSEICLGTMTWGSQNTQDEAHAQMDLALEAGVNFWDTAEMYPTNPVRAETIGNTERIIGNWFASRGGRDKVVLASKIVGTGRMVREGQGITGASLREVVEASLTRLKTDYIDIFQLHWPNRGSYHFRQMWDYTPTSNREETLAHKLDVLSEAQKLIDEGKIRHLGTSNDTVWGMANWLQIAKEHGLPRMVSVQNEYSLLCRYYDLDFAEFSAMENIPLLAYSPLATGLLAGKYAGGAVPERSRRAFTPDLGGRITPEVDAAVAAYLEIAARHGLDPCQMAIAFTMTRPYPVIPIIGATDLEQLKTDLGAAEVKLSDEVLKELNAAWRRFPAPF